MDATEQRSLPLFFPMTEPSAKQLGFLTKVVRKEGEDKRDQKKAMQQLFVDKKMDRFCLKKKKKCLIFSII